MSGDGMDKQNRISEIEILGDLQWGTHICQFYQAKEELLDLHIPYFRSGLENNEFCIWIISEPLEVEEAKKSLKEAIPDFDNYLEKGQIEFVPLADRCLIESIFSPEKALRYWNEKLYQALANGYEGLRAVEHIGRPGEKSWNGRIEYEQKLDAFTSKHKIILICPYYFDACSTTDIIELVKNHQLVLAKKYGKWEEIKNLERKNIPWCALTWKLLEDSEKQYRILFTNMTEGFGLVEVIYDKDGKPYDYRYLEINPAFKLSLGKKRDQILGKTMREAFPNLSPIALEKYAKVALSGQATHFEIFSQIANRYLDIYVFRPEKGKLALILRDITERKKIEKKLEESERKYRSIVETATEGIWIGNTEGKTTYVNQKLTEMVGYSQEEMLGKFAWDFTDEEGKPIIKQNIEKRRYGIDESYEFKFVHKDGSPLWAIVSSKSLFETDGKFAGSMSMLTDITRQKNVEVKLKETLNNLENLVKQRTAELENAYNSLKKSEESLSEAQKMAHLGNWEWDATTNDTYWSEELYRIFRRAPQQGGAPYQDFLRYVHPDDREYVDNASRNALNGIPYSIDFRIILANGEERTVHMQSEVILDKNNIPVRIKGIVQDITEHKKSEEKIKVLANAVESSNDAIVTESLNKDITNWNKGAEQIFGYSAEEILGNQMTILEPSALVGETEKLSKLTRQGIKVQQYETFRLRKDGKIIHVSITLSPVLTLMES